MPVIFWRAEGKSQRDVRPSLSPPAGLHVIEAYHELAPDHTVRVFVRSDDPAGHYAATLDHQGYPTWPRRVDAILTMLHTPEDFIDREQHEEPK